jgi:hypothetical protein
MAKQMKRSKSRTWWRPAPVEEQSVDGMAEWVVIATRQAQGLLAEAGYTAENWRTAIAAGENTREGRVGLFLAYLVDLEKVIGAGDAAMAAEVAYELARKETEWRLGGLAILGVAHQGSRRGARLGGKAAKRNAVLDLLAAAAREAYPGNKVGISGKRLSWVINHAGEFGATIQQAGRDRLKWTIRTPGRAPQTLRNVRDRYLSSQ